MSKEKILLFSIISRPPSWFLNFSENLSLLLSYSFCIKKKRTWFNYKGFKSGNHLPNNLYE
ncbi:MAG: hypothetical protein CMI27_01405 [Opitutae bacterium]|nr:hypothetical protein [Opitutae bacterium]